MKDAAGSLLDHLMDMNNTPEPRMPRVENLEFLDLMGVILSLHGAPAPEPGLSHAAANLPGGLWICGRSALPIGCASPASRASSKGGEMLTFVHIPTGTTVNKAIDVDASKSRGVAPAIAPTMIGAEIATGGATP